ncbi:dTDP-4-dehydrorhamnose 3,5-epimerase [Cellulophaga baltica]|uniref:dTDP-4-dehydrorhamnose 3,5-epimerase n=1 Tax=Cellulophaga TaxID=104264 RepID=UPI001C06B8EB|nr:MULTISPECIES: dTDP-4-dehydrorhamnose 3,5-epimerase [Cellulophaga]MBU2995984.1 dTDP-4-dehydrorhamnose 3,5-epimerase [Cellulophaga baltica]MDO6767379.1 dTDP-4-dehydrorhamnose 3,5-epimerase [Cellulophaga sp. 1_MG-2023]
MTAKETFLKGCFVLKPQILEDNRGCFFESFNHRTFKELIKDNVDFVQDNQSHSNKGVIRALHYQKGVHSQAKLVRVLKGAVLDVIVDLRKDSNTFGKHFSIELSAENKRQLFIPRGFAHGFSVLSETAEFFYKCDNYYNKLSESGIIYNDPTLNIDWKIEEENIIISKKDKKLPKFKDLII